MTKECIACHATESDQWHLVNTHDMTFEDYCHECMNKMWENALKDAEEHNAWVDKIWAEEKETEK